MKTAPADFGRSEVDFLKFFDGWWWKNGTQCGKLDTNNGGGIFMYMIKFKRRLRMAFSLLLCVLLCGCHINLFTSEHTELIVDGEYKPFNVPRKTMEKLMELIEAEDVDYIYAVFSPDVRENVERLSEQIRELIRFTKENVTAWDFISGGGNVDRRSGITISKSVAFYEFQTNSGTYRCDISDVIRNDTQKETIGFSSISIYPEELSWEYAPKALPGSSIVYRIEDLPPDISVGSSPVEMLMQLSEAGNPDEFCDIFSITAKRNAEGLQENASELMDFLSEQVISWEPYTWTQNIETIGRTKITVREMFFYLHTDNGLYRCDIREVLESDYSVDTGFSSISIFPALYPGDEPEYEDEVYKGYCTWERENMGISIVYQQDSQTR